MSIRTNLAQISVGMMLTMIAASSSLAQRIEPIAATLGTLTTEGNSTQPMHDASEQLPRREPMNAWRGTAGGLLGGGAGMVTGFFAGIAVAERSACSGEDCGLRNALIGGIVGEAIGLAVGVHYGSRGLAMER